MKTRISEFSWILLYTEIEHEEIFKALEIGNSITPLFRPTPLHNNAFFICQQGRNSFLQLNLD